MSDIYAAWVPGIFTDRKVLTIGAVCKHECWVIYIVI